MSKKLLIQLILLSIIILLLGLFYLNHILKDNPKVVEKPEINNLNIDSGSSNIIENIKYVVDDKLGNKYLIEAEYGEILEDNTNLILMYNVRALLRFSDREEIRVKAFSALYDVANYDTKFKKDVLVEYGEHKINCSKMDFLFKIQKIKLYGNINYNSLSTNLLADEMEIDLVSKDTKIYMKNNKKKIKIIYKDNGNY